MGDPLTHSSDLAATIELAAQRAIERGEGAAKVVQQAVLAGVKLCRERGWDNGEIRVFNTMYALDWKQLPGTGINQISSSIQRRFDRCCH